MTWFHCSSGSLLSTSTAVSAAHLLRPGRCRRLVKSANRLRKTRFFFDEVRVKPRVSGRMWIAPAQLPTKQESDHSEPPTVSCGCKGQLVAGSPAARLSTAGTPAFKKRMLLKSSSAVHQSLNRCLKVCNDVCDRPGQQMSGGVLRISVRFRYSGNSSCTAWLRDTAWSSRPQAL